MQQEMNQGRQWQVTGSAPEVYEHDLVPAVFGAWAPIVVELAQPRPGERVLDVACGTGIVARTVAGRVGPAGAVVATALYPGRLRACRWLVLTARGPGSSLPWGAACAEKRPFPGGSFSVV